ncbi:hypothetical protein AB0M46_51220 [Dactylosporangium sp. NPDC051485]|uniref:hypothetical protein n=1 Tax=Dactylosporangium sp. NPDC051485 TaxID=3154846 RepID=UPI003445E11C
MDSHTAWGDLDGDHVVDTQFVDVHGDGHFDVQYTDTNHDGVADVMLVDHNHDGVADVAVFSDEHGSGLVLVDRNGDGVADAVYTVGPFGSGHGDTAAAGSPYTTTATAAAGPFPTGGTETVAAGPFPTGDTAAVLNNVNSSMHDAGLIYRDAMHPGSVDQHDVDAAMQRTENAARNAQSLQGHTYQQQVSNDIHRGDLNRQYSEEAHRAATDAAIEAERGA